MNHPNRWLEDHEAQCDNCTAVVPERRAVYNLILEVDQCLKCFRQWDAETEIEGIPE